MGITHITGYYRGQGPCVSKQRKTNVFSLHAIKMSVHKHNLYSKSFPKTGKEGLGRWLYGGRHSEQKGKKALRPTKNQRSTFSGDFLSWASVAEQATLPPSYTWGESGTTNHIFYFLLLTKHPLSPKDRKCSFQRRPTENMFLSFIQKYVFPSSSFFTFCFPFNCSGHLVG